MDDIDCFLKEDLGEIGDITSNALFTDEIAEGRIFTKNECILAGLSELKQVFSKTGVSVIALANDGAFLSPMTNIAEVHGPIRGILSGERLALNMLGRMSGIATKTYDLVQKCRKINPKIEVAGTRKTTPGFRYYEKKAIEIGGGAPHRMGLFDAVMIKDNHIQKIGSVDKAIQMVQMKLPGKEIEIEVENFDDALIAAKNHVQVIMLDNFNADQAADIAKKIKEIDSSILIEISGGITPENIIYYASFSDRISLGYLTHTILNIDFSLELK